MAYYAVFMTTSTKSQTTNSSHEDRRFIVQNENGFLPDLPVAINWKHKAEISLELLVIMSK